MLFMVMTYIITDIKVYQEPYHFDIVANLLKSCYYINYNYHGRTGRKKLGGWKEICPTFLDCARVVKKKFSGETFQNCCSQGRARGVGVITKNSY